MAASVSGAEIVICAGAFISIFLFKYLISRSPKLSPKPENDTRLQNYDELPEAGRSSASLTPSSGTSLPSFSDRYSAGFQPVIGLENLGNTCYLNSLLQGLVCIPEFVSWIQETKLNVCTPKFNARMKVNEVEAPTKFHKVAVERSENRARNFFHSFSRAVEAMNSKRASGGRSYAASSLVSAMFDGAGSSMRNYQQDPDELFLYVNHLFSKAVSRQRNSVFNIKVKQIDELMSKQNSEYHDIASRPEVQSKSKTAAFNIDPTRENGIPFHGLLYEDLYCVVCKKSRPLPLELFTSLSLTFPYGHGRAQACFLEDLLRNYFTPADLDAVDCPTCTSKSFEQKTAKTPHLKRISLARLPKVLCIHIRRAVWDGTDSLKRPDIVNFGTNLFFNEYSWFRYLSESTKSARFPTEIGPTASGTYSLHSVIVHVGSLSSRGHVVAYRKGPVGSKNADCWYYTSDDVVRKVSWKEVENANPYMLFYQRK